MSAGQNGSDPMAYRPTSLDFINRPNPVEPHALPESHPLNDTQRLEKIPHAEFLRRLIDQPSNSNSERPAKRRKSGDAKLLDLPRLPAVKNGTKRLRIPPTLSGLHQPPPDAGLLPSISVDQPINLPNRTLPPEGKASTKTKPTEADPEPRPKANEELESQPKAKAVKPKRNKWSDEETADLLKGVSRFGIGNWTQILNCSDYHFQRRTALDLKDRFRVCCPNDYNTKRISKGKAARAKQSPVDDTFPEEPRKIARPNRSDRKSSSELLQLGIEEPFEKSKRRRRTDYTQVEDESLLVGFKKYGNSWAAIRQDPAFCLAHRKATDLRDRFRTKYPDRYEKAGLALRKDVTANKPKDTGTVDGAITNNTKINGPDKEVSTSSAAVETEKTNVDVSRAEKENKTPNTNSFPKKQTLPSLLHHDPDVFWGAPFDVDEPETERITLDRRILDWPFETAKPSTSKHHDSLAAFSLHKQAIHSSHASTSVNKTVASTASLPSLATITAGSDDFADHLELPSLMGTFPGLDADGRTGGPFPSIEELWK